MAASFEELIGYKWMPSRIPALDALVAIAPADKRDPAIDAVALNNPSRWYPVDGGFRVVVFYEGGWEFDATRFHIEKGAWDHEHCDQCGGSIEPMTLCWVTESGPYVLLCEACHEKVEAAGTK